MREQQEKCKRGLSQASGDDPVKGDGCQEDGARWIVSVVPSNGTRGKGQELMPKKFHMIMKNFSLW